MIELKDGTIIHPKRGNPPRPKKGYECLEGDPFTHVPILYPCKHRNVVKPDCTNCGAGAPRIMCHVESKEEGVAIRRIDCKGCDKREES